MKHIKKSAMQNVHFINWSETFDCYPELFFAPKTEEDISAILHLARETNKTVRVVGCKHSPSDIACTPDIMISLQNLNKVIQVDETKQQVIVQAGILIRDLNDTLYSHNLALSVLGSISDITVGGAISVCTHGSGIKHGTLSSYVKEMNIMLSDGCTMTFSGSLDTHLFLAALCSLGSFGVILEVTLQCEPAYNLCLRSYSLSLKDVIENLDTHLQASEHFKFLWYPYTDRAVMHHCSRTDRIHTKRSWVQKLSQWFWDYAIGYHLLEFCLYVSTFFPHFVPAINRIYYSILFSGSKSRIDRSYRIFNYDCLFKQHVNEWAIPVQETGLVLCKLKEWMEMSPNTFVHFPIEVRFSQAENIFLSPAFGRTTCYINIIMYRPYGKDVPYQKYWAAFENIMINAGGRPHWAKVENLFIYKKN